MLSGDSDLIPIRHNSSICCGAAADAVVATAACAAVATAAYAAVATAACAAATTAYAAVATQHMLLMHQIKIESESPESTESKSNWNRNLAPPNRIPSIELKSALPIGRYTIALKAIA